MDKIKRRKAKFLALLTLLSLIGCKTNETKDKEEMSITQSTASFLDEGKHIEIVDKNGVIYPTKTQNFIETECNAFARMSIALYDSYYIDKEPIGHVAEFQVVHRIFTNGKMSYVIREDGQTGYVYDELITVLPDNYVEVDISEQKVKVVDNNEIVLYCDVVTGKPGRDTDIGYTEVLSKTYNRPLTGPGYSLDVKYCIQFNTSEECFHDNRNRSEFGGDIYLTNGSLGCVNMNLEDVKVMDEHTMVGTKVVTHK